MPTAWQQMTGNSRRLALVALLAAGLAAPGHAAPDTEAVIRGKLARQMERLSFVDIELKDVIAFLRDYSGANIHVNWRILNATGIKADALVNVDVRKITVKQGLELVLRDISGAGAGPRSEATYAIEGNLILISTRSDLGDERSVIGKEVPNWAAEETKANAGVRKKLAGTVKKLSFREIDLEDVLQFLREYADLGINVNWRAMGSGSGIGQNTKISLEVENVTVRQALELVLRDASGTAETKDALAYTIEGGRLTISTYGELTRTIDAAHGRPWINGATSLAPGHSRTLSFTRPGKIAKVSVKEGQIVKAAQELVRLDDAAELEKLAQLKLGYSDVRVRATQIQLARERAYLDIVDARVKKGKGTMADLEHARLEVKIIEISMELARTQRKIDEHKYRESKIEVDRMRLISPIDGKVERILARAGECVGLLEPVVRVVKVGSDPLWIEVPVPFRQALGLKEGRPALVRLGGRWVPVRGKIVCVSATAEPVGQTLTVQVEVPNPAARPAGERVTVSFPAEGPDKGR